MCITKGTLQIIHALSTERFEPFYSILYKVNVIEFAGIAEGVVASNPEIAPKPNRPLGTGI